MKKSRILVLSPHTDDEVLGAGGTIARFIEEGRSVSCVAFTNCGKPELNNEFKNATKLLGINDNLALILTGINVREFQENRQRVLNEMIFLNRTIEPDLIICPSKNDIHQDHQVITQEAMRAFKHCSILGYEMPWNNYSFETDYFSKLTSGQLHKKIEAVKCYESQAHRPYCTEKYIESHAHVRGMQVGTEYAETFQLIRWIH
jgi:LmbE family N-acetylglucosaminyl deacetylase